MTRFRFDMKTCFKCGSVKPLTDFYPHKQMSDGHLNKCIQCARKDVADRAAKKSATDLEWVESERVRHRAKQAKYRTEGRAQPTTDEARKRWIMKNPNKISAHKAMSGALKSGQLVRASSCEKCGRSGRIEGHHRDYSKPLDVQWLCTKCHGETRHKPAPKYVPHEFDLIP